jgi:hypothetical protein
MNNAPQLANKVSEELEAIKQAFQNLLGDKPVKPENKNNKEQSQ